MMNNDSGDYRKDVRDISDKIAAKRDFYQPVNLQESYLAAVMSDVIATYYAVEQTLKLVNEVEFKTDKVIEDLKEAAKGLLLDVSEAKEEIDHHRTTMEQAMFAAIKGAAKDTTSDIVNQLKEHQNEYSDQVFEHSIKLGKALDTQFERLTKEADKRSSESASAAKKELFNVVDKSNGNKLLAYALVFAVCSSLLNGLVVYSVNRYFFNQKQFIEQSDITVVNGVKREKSAKVRKRNSK
jgi:predicted transcriptional regulator